jgi:hypothetical protein
VQNNFWLPLLCLASVVAVSRNVEASPPVPALAQPAEVGVDWTAKLPSGALASYFRATDKKLLVVGAGAKSPDILALAPIVIQGLRSSGAFELVMDNSAIGDVSALSDQDIVARAAGQPADALLVLRVFGEGAQASVVGTSYALDGTVIAAFSLAPGATLAVRADASAAAGIGQTAVNSVEAIMQTGGETQSELTKAEEEYLDRFLHFQYMVQFNVYTGDGRAFKTNQVLRGLVNEPLNNRSLLQYVGKPELADRYQSRRALKLGLSFSGALGFPSLVIGVSLLALVRTELSGCADAVFFDCNARPKALAASTGLMVAGPILITGFIIGVALPPLFKEKQKQPLVDSYNRELRRELGLPDDIEKTLSSKLSSNQYPHGDRDVRRARMLATWRLAPALSWQGAGAGFTGSF